MVGTVTDATGAVVPAAKVTVINRDTQIVSTSVTNEAGAYYVPFLAVGNYELTIEANGFKKYVQTGLQLRAAEVPRIDVHLELGAVNESVNVSSGAPLLDTETSVVSQTIEGRQINAMPILQQKPQRLLYYMIGVQNRGANSSVVGQSTSQLGYTLDGISGKTSIRDSVGDTNTSVQPALDALAEAKTYTTGAPAEIGHAAGGMLAFTFRSGTNQLHGSAEDRYTNRVMIHRNYLEQLPRTSPFTYHEMQGTLTGPVVIPHLYDGHNRTFFLFGYGRHHEKGNDPQTQTVPDAAMLDGNFSFPLASGGGFPIYDPRTIVQNGSTWSATPFSGNIIPKSQFDTVAKNFLALDPWKAANNPGGQSYSRSGPSNNWAGYTFYQSYRSRFDTKIDHQLTSANKFFVRNSYNRHRQTGRVTASVNNPLLDSATFGFGRPEPINQQNWAAADYHTFSPTLLNEARFGYNRRLDVIDPPTADQGWGQKLGIPNIGPEHFPGFSGLPGGIGPGSYSRNLNEDFTFQDNITKVLSRSTIKFGYEVIRTRQNNISAGTPDGSYAFTTAGTANPFVNNTGISFASFLLGAVNTASFNQQLISSLPRWWSHAFYVQSDWKASRNLTVNIGLRYSYETPYQTKYGYKSSWDPAAIDPLTGKLGAITHPTGYASNPDKNNFQPRVGLAWNFRPKMVFRGSWGLLTQDLLYSAGNQEYSASANFASPSGDPRPAFFLSQGPPNRPYVYNADGTSPFLASNNNYSSRSATFIDKNLRVPYVMNWSAGFQFDLGNNWVTEVLYQGSASVGGTGSYNWNQLPHYYYETSNATLLTPVSNAAQNYRPYTNFGNVSYTNNSAHNTFHSGIVRLEKRYSNGLTVNAHYTWSKNLGGSSSSGWNFDNWNLNKSLNSGFDTRDRIILQALYELPVGKGRRFLGNAGWINNLVGGWEISWIHTLQSGSPVTFGFSNSPNKYLENTAGRPVQISDDVKVQDWAIGANRFPQTAQNPYYRIDSFAYPAAFTNSSLGAGTETGFWTNWIQWSVGKAWRIAERVNFRVRVDANNIPVLPQFGSPNTTVNFSNRAQFGTLAPQGANFSTLGTGNGNVIAVARLEF